MFEPNAGEAGWNAPSPGVPYCGWLKKLKNSTHSSVENRSSITVRFLKVMLKLFVPLALTVACGMFAGYFASLLVTPVACRYFLGGDHEGRLARRARQAIDRVADRYQEALRAVSRELMRNHLKHCAASAIRSGPEEAEAMYDELVNMMYKSAR